MTKRAAERFDLIILDPPKFAPTSVHAEKAARAYKDINLLAFKLLPQARLRWGELLPGSVFAGVGWWVLQTSGAVYIQRTIDNAGPTYDTFATVIGLLTFFFLASQLVILGAEINVVRSRRLYPRSLLAAHGELTDADRQVYADSAGATRRLAGQRVQVGFRSRPPG